MKIKKMSFVHTITTIIGALSPICVLAGQYLCTGSYRNTQTGEIKTANAGWLSTSGVVPTCACTVGRGIVGTEPFKIGEIKMFVNNEQAIWTYLLLSRGPDAHSSPWEFSSCQIIIGPN